MDRMELERKREERENKRIEGWKWNHLIAYLLSYIYITIIIYIII